MAVEIEFITMYTGMVGNTGETGIYQLQAFPTTGPNGEWDIAVDPVDGPAQVYCKQDQSNVSTADFGITGTPAGLVGQAIMYYDDVLPNSDIRDNLLNPGEHGVSGLQTFRIMYNY